MVGTGLVALPLGRPPEPPSAPQMMPEPGSSPTPAFSPPRGLGRNLAHYGDANLSVFLRKAFIKALGYTDDALSRPVIGLVNTASGFNACHHNVPELIDAASRGILLRGGIPIPFPVISLHEMFVHPTSMYLRNLMSMDVEEMIRAQPMDAVVLIGGCDKTVPALLMGGGKRKRTGHPAAHWPHADGLLARRAGRRLHRLPSLLGSLSRGRGHGRGNR
jgi:hypothetical protein